MKIAIGADHAGAELKNVIGDELRAAGHTVEDVGTNDPLVAVDYPDYAAAVGKLVQSGACERGIVICGSGAGACIAANKLLGIRAALCHDTYSAHQSVEHDDANVLCLGSRIIGAALAADVVSTFIAARFSGGERHVRRLAKLDALDQRVTQPRV